MNTKSFEFEEKTELLTDAFRLFNELSENLAQSYQGLQHQVARLTHELATARHERMTTLIDKERLASRLQQILAALPAAVLIVDAAGKIIDANEHASGFLGEPLLNQPWNALMSERLRISNAAPYECQLLDGRTVSLTFNSLGNEGEQLILLSDVSELRDLQDSLAQQRHLTAMGEMVASLAHQVRTPLATAILYASHTIKPDLGEERRMQFSEKILKRLHYLERQINDMLIFAKQGHLSLQSIILHELIEDIEEAIAETPVLFLLINRAGQRHLLGHQDALRGACLNLLNNAVEANAQNIRMTVDYRNQTLLIEISDDGVGIAPSLLKQIFDPFFTTKNQGTGLGLAVVKGVVEAHHGTISCDSILESGSRFLISLPCPDDVYPINLSSVDRDLPIGEYANEAL
ncbi:MAG: hypothetical protein RL563_2739 [Pseudomonadota bacterium]|jgi:two-component system sensor histidine kinase FlrB